MLPYEFVVSPRSEKPTDRGIGSFLGAPGLQPPFFDGTKASTRATTHHTCKCVGCPGMRRSKRASTQVPTTTNGLPFVLSLRSRSTHPLTHLAQLRTNPPPCYTLCGGWRKALLLCLAPEAYAGLQRNLRNVHRVGYLNDRHRIVVFVQDI